jgi:hypothetical protein
MKLICDRQPGVYSGLHSLYNTIRKAGPCTDLLLHVQVCTLRPINIGTGTKVRQGRVASYKIISLTFFQIF